MNEVKDICRHWFTIMEGKDGCFLNWHETQSKFSLDIELNKPLETKCCNREEDAWPMVLKIESDQPVWPIQPGIGHQFGLVKTLKTSQKVEPGIGGKNSSCPGLIFKTMAWQSRACQNVREGIE